MIPTASHYVRTFVTLHGTPIRKQERLEFSAQNAAEIGADFWPKRDAFPYHGMLRRDALELVNRWNRIATLGPTVKDRYFTYHVE
jgi:hypothetical protein